MPWRGRGGGGGGGELKAGGGHPQDEALVPQAGAQAQEASSAELCLGPPPCAARSPGVWLTSGSTANEDSSLCTGAPMGEER